MTPQPVEPPQLTDAERLKWFAEFETLGREAVRIAISRGQGLSPIRKRELAVLWLREREIEKEDREVAEYRISNGRSSPLPSRLWLLRVASD